METRRFAYPDPVTGNLWIGHPSENTKYSFDEICKRDTPAGQPYVILDVNDLPLDAVAFAEAWEVDFSNPDGYGIGHDDWDAWYSENGGSQ